MYDENIFEITSKNYIIIKKRWVIMHEIAWNSITSTDISNSSYLDEISDKCLIFHRSYVINDYFIYVGYKELLLYLEQTRSTPEDKEL